MKSRFTITFDLGGMAQQFCITPADMLEYLTDGRRVSFILERRLVWEHPEWKLAPSEKAGYDLRAPDGGLWEVRCVTANGVYFNPSNQVGKGRSFDEGGFLAKIEMLAGYILADITRMPQVPVYRVPSALVKQWYRDGKLGTRAQVSLAAFNERLEPDIPA